MEFDRRVIVLEFNKSCSGDKVDIFIYDCMMWVWKRVYSRVGRMEVVMVCNFISFFEVELFVVKLLFCSWSLILICFFVGVIFNVGYLDFIICKGDWDFYFCNFFVFCFCLLFLLVKVLKEKYVVFKYMVWI